MSDISKNHVVLIKKKIMSAKKNVFNKKCGKLVIMGILELNFMVVVMKLQ